MSVRTGPEHAARTVSVAPELDLHEQLLRAGVPAVRVGVAAEPALSYGVGVRGEPGYLRRAADAGLPTARRTTGGTGIVHLRGDLLWAVVLPRTDPRVGRDFVRAYARLGAGVVDAVTAEGFEARWVAAPGLAEAYCPLSSRGEVLEVDGAIAGAAAQHATSRALLHHGTLSLSIDRDLVDRIFELPTPGPSRRLGAAVRLRETPGSTAMAERLAARLSARLAASGSG